MSRVNSSKISARPAYKLKGLRDDDDDLNFQILNPSPTVSAQGEEAKAKGLQVYEGHKLITPKLKEICDVSSWEYKLYSFAFSAENWKRSKEVDFLMQLFEEFFT
ncbi:Dehydrodolichyl diphosphate synthase [Datura stramonium]|uniref:Dehydrodolichyl diphosphate synthase n=1 Tax=Datura stramonium TaxID=4076 RepID=A0ABS8TDJ9_DATST|nr:Dehydrodolichyl diphosphate synthase [Datura stramonium]